MRTYLLLLLVFLMHVSIAQEAEMIKPGVLYPAGTVVESPRYGFRGVIPEGWNGMLPQGAEILLLNRPDGTGGQVYMFARNDGSPAIIKEQWRKGMEITPGIYLKAADEIEEENGLMMVEVMAEGKNVNRSYREYLMGVCSEYGPCLTLLLVTPEQFYEESREEMLDMMEEIEFLKPGSGNPYEKFNWKNFLENKVLVTYQIDQGSKRENQVHLCADGSFRSVVRQSGWLKQQNKAYLGRNDGVWSVSGTGKNSVLKLAFEDEKIPPLEIPLKIDDEKIYAFGDRYYAGYSDHCNQG